MMLSVFVIAGLAFAQEPATSPAPRELEVKEASQPAAAGHESPDAFIEAGLKAFRKRRYAQAEIDFRKAAEADPQSAAAAFYLGYTYYKVAEPKRPFHPDKKKAADLFARAFELDPGFKPVWGPRKR